MTRDVSIPVSMDVLCGIFQLQHHSKHRAVQALATIFHAAELCAEPAMKQLLTDASFGGLAYGLEWLGQPMEKRIADDLVGLVAALRAGNQEACARLAAGLVVEFGKIAGVCEYTIAERDSPATTVLKSNAARRKNAEKVARDEPVILQGLAQAKLVAKRHPEKAWSASWLAAQAIIHWSKQNQRREFPIKPDTLRKRIASESWHLAIRGAKSSGQHELHGPDELARARSYGCQSQPSRKSAKA